MSGIKSLRSWRAAATSITALFSMVREVSPALLYLNVASRTLRGFIPLSLLYVGKLIVDEIVLLSTGEVTTSPVWLYVALEFAIAMCSHALIRLTNYLDKVQNDLINKTISVKLIDHSSILDIEYFENPEFYDKLERSRNQLSSTTQLLSQAFVQLQQGSSVLFLGVGLVAFSPWLLLFMMVALVPAFVGETYFKRMSYELNYRFTADKRELEYIRFLGCSHQSAKEIKIFQLGDFLSDKFVSKFSQYFEESKALAARHSLWGFFLAIVGFIGYYGAYTVIIMSTISGDLSLGDMVFLSGSFMRLNDQVENMISRTASMFEGALHMSDLFDFLKLEPKIVSQEAPTAFPDNVERGIVFDQVGFRYPGSDAWALRGVSFEWRVGETVALVGENGSGKTTIIKLLARLYDPSEGTIYLDGKDLKSYDLEELRSNISVAFQDFMKYEMTVSENIAVGNIGMRGDEEAVEEAARSGMAHSFIGRLPAGYDQVVGRRFKGGLDLSGGEWQKLALARVYMSDAQLLVLDEPTAALDPRSEYEVFQHFASLASGKTALLVSHRLSSVRIADRVLVLGRGRVLDYDTHDRLMEKGGYYAELYTLQASGYEHDLKG